MFSTRIQRVDKLQNRDSMRKMSKVHNQTRRKRRRCTKTAVECGTKSGSISGCNDAGIHEPERFGFEPGPSFTLDKFQKYADDFKAQYFRRNENITGAEGNTSMLPEHWEPSIEDIEGEYWRIVEKATEEIEVQFVRLNKKMYFLLYVSLLICFSIFVKEPPFACSSVVYFKFLFKQIAKRFGVLICYVLP